MTLADALRTELSRPLGPVLKEPDWNEPFIAVGDDCVGRAARAGKRPLLAVYDLRTKRRAVTEETKKEIASLAGLTIHVKNPAGGVTKEADYAIRTTLSLRKQAKIQVDGEEDLLVLPAIIHAPLGTTVYYGQPGEGIVKVSVTTEMKEIAKKYILAMEG